MKTLLPLWILFYALVPATVSISAPVEPIPVALSLECKGIAPAQIAQLDEYPPSSAFIGGRFFELYENATVVYDIASNGRGFANFTSFDSDGFYESTHPVAITRVDPTTVWIIFVKADGATEGMSLRLFRGVHNPFNPSHTLGEFGLWTRDDTQSFAVYANPAQCRFL